jgi:hypothetical protein
MSSMDKAGERQRLSALAVEISSNANWQLNDQLILFVVPFLADLAALPNWLFCNRSGPKDGSVTVSARIIP